MILDFASRFNLESVTTQWEEGSGQPVCCSPLRTNSPIQKLIVTSDIANLETNIRNQETDGDDILWKDPSLSWSDLERVDKESTIEDKIPHKIYGDPTLKAALKDLCIEFSDIFSRKLNSQPALVRPMTIETDLQAWQLPKNRGPARIQTRTKEEEIEMQINEMLSIGLIRPSQAAYYSQVHLVPKPNGSWRFCIDYRNLNKVCSDLGWPLPNISQTLQRVGARRPKFFAKFDMTSGYYQCPISETCKALTAFITFMGTYEWNRVPMGPKGSASYFQQQIATVVLVGLVYHICEQYLDDILAYASSGKELLIRLRLLFERFRKFKITLNPDKCELGLSSVEYTGHVIDETGLSFTDKKLSGVKAFPIPDTQKQLKSFLGLANYFRDHVRNLSIIVQPLQQLLIGYGAKTRNKLIIWSEKDKKCFETVKDSVSNCQKLYFIDDKSPILLVTDASDYGIGALLSQLIYEIWVPIMFISLALSKVQQRWSVPEKECYSIVYAFQKMDHLIRDRVFTLKTDHENLTRVYSTGSPKVLRWKLFIQEYSFTIEHIKGSDNEVADALSRLCPIEDIEEHNWFNAINEFVPPTDLQDTKRKELDMIAPLSIDETGSIPRDIYRKIGQVHNSVVGHHGVSRTVDKLTRKGEKFPHLREYVRDFIRKCPCCQKLSQIKIPIETSPFSNATYSPMRTLHLDSIGPLPASDGGFDTILVIICSCTRFVELYATQGTSAESTIDPLVQHVGRYGCPAIIQSDNGSQFVNKIINELVVIIGTRLNTTLAYSKEENGLVERANKEVIRHLRALIYELNSHKNWPRLLPLVQRIMNSAVHSSTGVSPADLVYGQAINLDRGILLDDPDTVSLSLSKGAAQMLEVQRKLLLQATMSQQEKDGAHMASRAAIVTEFPVNSFVLAEYPNTRMGKIPPNKFNTNLKGPLRVVSFIGSKYKLLNLITNEVEDYHVKRLRKFDYYAETTCPTSVALRDRQETVVGEILRHSGDPKRISTLDFLVRWQGFDDKENLWVPWKELRNNPILHQYLRDHGMKTKIPKEHRARYE